MHRSALPFPAVLLFCTGLSAQIEFTPRWRELGPANMSGRVVDLAVDPTNPARWFVATASGGLFRTTNAGTTFKPLFQHQNTISIGAVALDPGNPDVVWVGTGEANPRNSVSWGDGVYVSRDAGETWQHVGLDKTFQIGCIAIHPQHGDTVYVAACGRLWGPNPERGVYRTRNGGKRWERVLKLGEDTGAIDLLIDPQDPQVVFAASYERRRDQYDGNDPIRRWGPGSGLWKSTDGGNQWQRLTDGLPTVAIGRIGLAMAPSDHRVLYAVIETERSGWATGTEQAPKDAKGKPHKGFGTRLGGQVANVQQQQGPAGFETGGVFVSKDSGASWQRVNSLTPRPFYFSQIRVDPQNPDRVYVLGIQYYVSKSGGEKFDVVTDHGIHVDFHAMWIDPKNPQHWLIGSDGGLYETFNSGTDYRFFANLPCAQFYRVAVDDRDPFHVYGGLQDNGSWGLPTRTRYQDGILLGDVFKFGMGDGFRVVTHPKDTGLLYFTSQYGRIGWFHVLTGKRGGVRMPKPPKDARLRFNWDTPFMLSPHDPEQLWIAGNFVIRATERGQKTEILSPELTDTGRGTATALTLSAKKRGLALVGTDDGTVWVTRDNGGKWKDLTGTLPKLKGPRFVSSLLASRHSSSVVYLAFDGHRSDDLAPYVYVSRSSGGSWSKIIRGLDRGPVRSLTEDPENPDLLFAGTEFGIYASLDRGRHWYSIRGNLPTVPVHEMVVQERERQLVIATHGRGLWTADIAGLQRCLNRVQSKPLALLEPQVTVRRTLLPPRVHVGDDTHRFANPPRQAALYYWVKRKLQAPLTLEVLGKDDKVLCKLPTAASEGLQQAIWDLRADGKQGRRGGEQGPGTYTIRLTSGKTVLTQKLVVTDE